MLHRNRVRVIHVGLEVTGGSGRWWWWCQAGGERWGEEKGRQTFGSEMKGGKGGWWPQQAANPAGKSKKRALFVGTEVVYPTKQRHRLWSVTAKPGGSHFPPDEPQGLPGSEELDDKRTRGVLHHQSGHRLLVWTASGPPTAGPFSSFALSPHPTSRDQSGVPSRDCQDWRPLNQSGRTTMDLAPKK